MSTADQFAYAEPYRGPGWAPPRPRTEPLAVAALVTGLLALGPVALALGVVALRRTRLRGTPGRGLAIAGIVLGAVETLALVGLLVASLLTANATRPLPADLGAPREAHAQQLVVGSCLRDLPPDGSVDTVTAVPCGDPHAARVVSAFRFDDVAWPGQDEADRQVGRSCALSDDEAAAGASVVAWAPTDASWSAGDRTGLCLVVGGT